MSDKFLFLAGNLSLDFLNTQIMRHGKLTNLLDKETDFAEWLQEAQIFGDDILEQIPQDWWGEIFPQVLEFRKLLREMVEALEDNQAVPEASITAINHYLLPVPAFQQIEVIDREYHSHFRYDISQIEQLLYPIAESARELLCESDHSRIKQCSSDTCVLHFYDTSKNASRRWCSMETCGNRRKVKRHYRRKQSE